MTARREWTLDADGPVRVVEHPGAGPRTFVCVHGLGGSADDWEFLAPLLARRGRVVAFDLPGFGETPLAGRAPTLDGHGRALARVLAQTGDGPALLVGNSMGGALSLQQASRAPATVAGLALISPALPVTWRAHAHPLVTAQFALYALPWLGEWYVHDRRRRVDVRERIDRTLSFTAARLDAIPAAALEARYVQAQRNAQLPDSVHAFLSSARSLLRALAGPGYRRTVARVATDTLVIHGALDRLVPVTAARRAGRRRRDWTVAVLPGVGHIGQIEAPERVAELIAGWLPPTEAAPRAGDAAAR